MELPSILSSAIRIKGLNLDLSPENIRSLLKDEETIADAIPQGIRNYIAKHGLYRE